MIRLLLLFVICLALSACSKKDIKSEEMTDGLCLAIAEMIDGVSVDVDTVFKQGYCLIYFPDSQDYSKEITEVISSKYGEAKIILLTEDMLPLVSEEWVEYFWRVEKPCSILLFDYHQGQGAYNTGDSIKVSCS